MGSSLSGFCEVGLNKLLTEPKISIFSNLAANLDENLCKTRAFLRIQHIVMTEGIDEHRSIRYHVIDKMGALSVRG